MVGELGEDVGEPGARIDVIELACLGQRIDGCGATAPLVEPAKVQLRRPTATQRRARSAALFETQILPSSRKRMNEGHRVSM